MMANNDPFQISVTNNFFDLDMASGGFLITPFCNNPNATIVGSV